jgi:hypothetical protein
VNLVGIRFSLGTASIKTLSADHESSLVKHYNSKYPDLHILHRADDAPINSRPNFLNINARYHSYLILDGRRLIPSKSRSNAPNSLVQMDLSGTRYVGQVFDILSHTQVAAPSPQYLLDVRWFKRFQEADTSPWDP